MALRRILHLDMDAFYASVEQRDDPSLRGKPVAVGGRVGERGVVAAASYEARTFGVRSAMSMAAALRNCPQLVVVRPGHRRGTSACRSTVFELFRAVTPLVEPLSLDEAYLDVTENAWNEPLGVTVARRLKQQVREATRLTVSAGVAPNKFLAEDRLRLEEAGRPDGHRAGARRGVPPEAAGRRAVGRRAEDRGASCAPPASSSWSTSAPGRGRADRAGRQHGRLAARARRRRRRAPRRAASRNEVERIGEHLHRGPDRPRHHPVRGRQDGRGRGALAREAGHAGADGDAEGALQGLPHHHAQPTPTPPTRDAASIIDRAVRLVDKTDAGATPVRLIGVSVSGLGAGTSRRPSRRRSAAAVRVLTRTIAAALTAPGTRSV